MNALNRAILREILEGNIKWGSYMAFAEIGALELVRNYGTGDWKLVITSGNQVRLGWLNQIALRIAAIYAKDKPKD